DPRPATRDPRPATRDPRPATRDPGPNASASPSDRSPAAPPRRLRGRPTRGHRAQRDGLRRRVARRAVPGDRRGIRAQHAGGDRAAEPCRVPAAGVPAGARRRCRPLCRGRSRGDALRSRPRSGARAARLCPHQHGGGGGLAAGAGCPPRFARQPRHARDLGGPRRARSAGRTLRPRGAPEPEPGARLRARLRRPRTRQRRLRRGERPVGAHQGPAGRGGRRDRLSLRHHRPRLDGSAPGPPHHADPRCGERPGRVRDRPAPGGAGLGCRRSLPPAGRFRRRPGDPGTPRIRARCGSRTGFRNAMKRLGLAARIGGGIAITLVTALLLLPVAALLLRVAPGRLIAELQEPAVREALGLSLWTSVTALMVVILLGLPVAWLLAFREFRGRRLFEVLITLPIVLPPTVAGLALLLAFGRAGLLGGTLSGFGISIPFTSAAVVMAQVFVALPFFITAATAGFREVDRSLTDVAATLGAPRVYTFFRIVIPLAAPSLVAGAAMGWARALGEFGATITFAGNLPGVTQTMPLAVYLAFETNLEAAVALAVVLLAVSFGVLLAVRVNPFGPRRHAARTA